MYFFQQVPDLETMLERKFRFLYLTGMSLSDYRSTDIFELDWLFGRLEKQKSEERKSRNTVRWQR